MWMHAAWYFIDDTLRTLLQCMCVFFPLSPVSSPVRSPTAHLSVCQTNLSLPV